MTPYLFLPYKNLEREDWDCLTENRIDILVDLLDEPKNLTNLSESTDKGVSTVNKTLDRLLDRNLLEKDENKVYNLTDKGEFLAIMLSGINGKDEEFVYDSLEKKIRNKLESNGFDNLEASKKAYHYRQNLQEFNSIVEI